MHQVTNFQAFFSKHVPSKYMYLLNVLSIKLYKLMNLFKILGALKLVVK